MLTRPVCVFRSRSSYVLNLMKSLRSRGYAKETFCWRWFYYYLTEEGVEYLREYLHLPQEIVPATLKKQAARPSRPDGSYEGGKGDYEGGKGKGYGKGKGKGKGERY